MCVLKDTKSGISQFYVGPIATNNAWEFWFPKNENRYHAYLEKQFWPN